MNFQRVFLTGDPYYRENSGNSWFQANKWPASWITHPEAPAAPFAAAYRNAFELSEATTVRAHVSADERYELFIDGERVAMGSERGDVRHWFFETYEFELPAGPHTIVALVPSIGAQNPYAQMTLHHGFLFAPQAEEHKAIFATGTAAWDAKLLDGLEWFNALAAWGTGANLKIDGARYSWGVEQGLGDDWTPAVEKEPAVDGKHANEITSKHLLMPATLPAMLEEQRRAGTVRLVSEIPALKTSTIAVRAEDNLPEELKQWQRLVEGDSAVQIAPHTCRRVLLDLDNYYCARPVLKTSGGAGATVRVFWQEALYERGGGDSDKGKPWSKGNRSEIEGKYFTCFAVGGDGDGDVFLIGGGQGRVYSPFWWQAGRYIEICVETDDDALTIEDFYIRETRYPMEMESRFASNDPRFEAITPIMVRALQMCAHETYMDCPFYEQLMYVGDTRLEVLATWAATSDDRLPQKAVRLFDMSRQLSGLTQSRYPSKVLQIIPPFSLWHVCMIHDRALWKDTPEFDRTLLSGARGVMDYFLSRRNADGLIESPEGWNFTDWVPTWPGGEPPSGREGVNGTINWQTVMTLRKMAELETWHGEPELATRWERNAATLQAALHNSLWNQARGLYTEDATHQHFSQHTQCLAVLSGALEAGQSRDLMSSLLAADDLAKTTIMFRFYLMEALYQTRLSPAFEDQLPLWFQLPQWGFKTTWEEDDPNTTRSDCHAWGAHPLYHYFASILGIRPASRGFETVHIAPLLGSLERAEGELPHPRGSIAVEYTRSKDALQAKISLPANVSGNFEWNGTLHPLSAGEQNLDL